MTNSKYPHNSRNISKTVNFVHLWPIPKTQHLQKYEEPRAGFKRINTKCL